MLVAHGFGVLGIRFGCEGFVFSLESLLRSCGSGLRSLETWGTDVGFVGVFIREHYSQYSDS